MVNTLLRVSAMLGLLALAPAARAQVGIGTPTPDASAVLDLKSTSKGLLAPRMTATERAAIASPAAGLLVFQTDGVQPGFWYYSATAWTYLSPTGGGADNLGNHTATQPLNLNGQWLSGDGTAKGLQVGSTGTVTVQAGPGSADPLSVANMTTPAPVPPPGPTFATASSETTLRRARSAFDGGSSFWYGGSAPAWIQQDFGASPRALNRYDITYTGTSWFDEEYLPETWQLLASNDGSTWTTLDTRSGIRFTASPTPRTFSFTNTTPYRYYRWNVTASLNGNVLIEEITMYSASIPQALFAVTAAGQLRLPQGAVAGRVLTSDASGLSTWQPVPSSADNLGNHSATQGLDLNDYPVYLRGNGSAQHQLRFSSDVDGPQLFGGSGGELGINPGTYAPVLRWNGSGNVGIGTTAPTQKLEVAGQIYSSTGGIRFPDNTVQTTAAAGDNLGNHSATQNLNLGASQLVGNGGSTGLGISAAGNVGIGTGAPVAPLEVLRDNSSVYALFHDPGDHYFSFGQDRNAGNSIKISDGNGFGGTNYLTIQRPGGNVGIGTATPAPSAQLELSSTTKGFLPPRLSSVQRDAISSPALGLTIYNVQTGRLNIFNGTSWGESLSTTDDGLSGIFFAGYTGAPQTWTVPAGVSSVRVELMGAAGTSVAHPGGKGGQVQATLAVTPGQVLTVYVGGSNGYNGGGTGCGYESPGANGGGATDIRLGGAALSNRVLVAGGGGGGAGGHFGGAAGGSGGGLTAGGGGSNGAGGTGGGGGTQTAGGWSLYSANAGGLGFGGAATNCTYGTGGGGGGYYGGGGGDSTGGGGGGSSYASPTLATNVAHTPGLNSGNGYVRISVVAPAAPALSLTNATVPFAAGSVVFSDGTKLAGNAGQLAWDNSGTRLGIGTGSPQAKLHVVGEARISTLGGSGSRMVTTDNNGQLATQALPTDAQALSIAGSTISLTNGGSVTVPSSADNLGNHTATQNLNLGTFALVGNGSTGLTIGSTGTVTSGGNVNLAANQLVGNGGSSGVAVSSTGNVGINLTTPTNRLDVQNAARSGPHPSGRPLYVTGDINAADSGVEIRHTNSTQGVGIGYNTLYAAGTNTNQDLNLLPKGTGKVGIGTTTPGDLLDVNGNQTVRGALGFGSSTRQMLNLWNTVYGIGVQSNTQYFRSGESFAWFIGGSHADAQFDGGGGSAAMVLKAGQLGIGTTSPIAALDVPNGSVHLPGDSWIRFSGTNYNYLRGTTIFADDAQGGRVGIGTANPAFPLDVQSTVTPGNYAYAFFAAAANGTANSGSTGGSTGPVSIRATGRILATEFNATSDRRLKSVIGLSDNAADLGLLTQIRITDYTMRDRAQYGARQFKKVIAQEVELVFPQAVNQHAGFLPDVYASATAATAEGDSLLRLTLPQALTAQAGQRIRLIGPAGEVTATVARPATGRTLLVRGAQQLAGQQVFVFGLEHPDVRTVDYEALAMLNVSATQELARQLAALQARAANAEATAQQAAASAAQATAALESLTERLRALEAGAGQARR